MKVWRVDLIVARYWRHQCYPAQPDPASEPTSPSIGSNRQSKSGWTHVLTLHRRNSTLNKELKEAERALGEELSEQNFARLQDVRSQLSALDGTEASIEGFGSLSGRPVRGL
jgi:DNA primase